MLEAALPHTDLLHILHQRHGIDFSGYRLGHVQRRIAHRVQQLGFLDDATYLDYLMRTPAEADQLFTTVLNNHTLFFRDPEMWQTLADEIIPAIIARKPPHEPLRVWSAGCASGQEVYSLAMLLAESLGTEQLAARAIIYATDVDADALRQVRAARYDQWAMRHVPAPLLERACTFDGRHYTAREFLRKPVVVRRHNLVDAVPFAHIDLLLCRNTLLYFTPATQARVLAHLHAALAEDGFLALGRSETIWYSPGAFEWVDRRQRIVAKAASFHAASTLPTMPGGLVAGNGHWDGGMPPSQPGPVPHDLSRHP